jgi:hypothetical protein
MSKVSNLLSILRIVCELFYKNKNEEVMDTLSSGSISQSVGLNIVAHTHTLTPFRIEEPN